MNIVTNRLIIKPYDPNIDLDQVMQLQLNSGNYDDENQVLNNILTMYDYDQQSNRIMGYKCIFLPDQTLIGVIVLYPYFTDIENRLEIGITIANHYQNNGLGTEAMQSLIQHYINDNLIRSRYTGLYAQTSIDNIACQKLLSKVGFQFHSVIKVCCDQCPNYGYILDFN